MNVRGLRPSLDPGSSIPPRTAPALGPPPPRPHRPPPCPRATALHRPRSSEPPTPCLCRASATAFTDGGGEYGEADVSKASALIAVAVAAVAARAAIRITCLVSGDGLGHTSSVAAVAAAAATSLMRRQVAGRSWEGETTVGITTALAHRLAHAHNTMRSKANASRQGSVIARAKRVGTTNQKKKS